MDKELKGPSQQNRSKAEINKAVAVLQRKAIVKNSTYEKILRLQQKPESSFGKKVALALIMGSLCATPFLIHDKKIPLIKKTQKEAPSKVDKKRQPGSEVQKAETKDSWTQKKLKKFFEFK